MATWDGSYSGPDEQNYYVYPDHGVSGTVTENWILFPGNMSNDCAQSSHEYYVQNEPVLEQSSSNTFYRSDLNVTPSLVSTANNLYKHVIEPIDKRQIFNHHESFPNNVKPQRCYVPGKYYSHNYHSKKNKIKHNSHSKDDIQTTNCKKKQSKLHVSAEEFVPNDTKSTDVKHELQKAESIDIEHPSVKDHSRLSNSYYFGNVNKNEKRFNNKSCNYKPRDCQRDQYYKKNVYAKSYPQQGKTSYKYQDDKHFSNECYFDKSQPDVTDLNEISLDKSTINVTADNSKGNYVTHLNEKESRPNTDVNASKSSNLPNKDNDEEAVTTNNDNVKTDGTRKSNNHGEEIFYYDSELRQPYNNYKNIKKHVYNVRPTRQENLFKGRHYNNHGYNRENYKKKINLNSQGRNNGDHAEFKDECPNVESGPELKDNKEKKLKSHVYSGYKDHSKERKTESYVGKDKSKNYTLESKEKGHEYWRSKRDGNEKNNIPRYGLNKKSAVDDDANQRERLADQLNRGQLECLVCCEYIKQNDYIWSCSNCYHVLHLKCIKKWAKSSQAGNGWRCPACQNVNLIIPEDYFCFCGKTKVPDWNRRDVAHSCGETCGRMLSKNACPHKCTLLCHPGSCPQCTAMVTKYCSCGKTSQTVQCSTHKLLLCDSVCGKDLNCGKHKCEQKCHYENCSNCEKTVIQECYCGKNTRQVICQANLSIKYSCEEVCGKLLECGNHTCKKLCHENACEPCILTPDKITTCCCGQTPLTEKRQTCLAPIPICDKICSKNLKCGQPNNPHKCKAKCHQGDCPNCDLTTDVKCRCGNMDREIACKDLRSKADDARCEKRCTKKRSCGRHKCNQLCCIEIEHVCPLICSKTLSCGRHKCEQSCHKGRCQSCWHSSFDELYCECGASVIYPPVPCGTRKPTCDRPCSRQHSCGHEVLHNCHSESICPPCTVLTQRWCHGKHELRKAVPCYITEISCGLPCNKPISCGHHKCITLCHPGPCERPGQLCSQPCVTPRELCGHICAAPCHEGKCPDTPCKEMVKVTCQCGHRTMTRVCAENSREYQRIASCILASKMADMQLGHSINLEQVFGQGVKKQNQLKTLECNDECKLIERNRRLALGFQIVNSDLSAKLMPRYSDFMKQWAKKDPHFCQMIHDKLTELVQLAKVSKQKSRSYSFDCMNKDKRHFVHESCEHFGCDSQAYDQEPKRNVVATAIKDKCWLPGYSLMEIVQRENGQRKVPGPMLNTSKTDGSVKTILSLPPKKNQKPDTPLNIKVSEPEIDYFDYQG